MTNVSDVQGNKTPILAVATTTTPPVTTTKPDELSAKLSKFTPEPKIETKTPAQNDAIKATGNTTAQIKIEEVRNPQGQVIKKIIDNDEGKIIQDLDSDGKISHMTKYGKNGQKTLETSFKDGHPFSSVEYDENGNKTRETICSDKQEVETLYENGQKTTEKIHTPDGGTVKETHYKAGVITDSKDYKFGVHTDGEIGNYRQGMTGDCWALGGMTTLASMTGTEEGRKAIKESISQDETTGNVTVELKGVGEKYTFTPAQIKERKDLSHGDDDAKVLEMAMEGHRRKLQASSPDGKLKKNASIGIPEGCEDAEGVDLCAMQSRQPLSGGDVREAWYDITGKLGVTVEEKDLSKTFDELQKNPSGKAVLMSFTEKNSVYTSTPESVSSDPNFKLLLNHAYVVKRVDGENITVTEPHDNSKEQTVSSELILKHKPEVEILDLTKA